MLWFLLGPLNTSSLHGTWQHLLVSEIPGALGPRGVCPVIEAPERALPSLQPGSVILINDVQEVPAVYVLRLSLFPVKSGKLCSFPISSFPLVICPFVQPLFIEQKQIVVLPSWSFSLVGTGNRESLVDVGWGYLTRSRPL